LAFIYDVVALRQSIRESTLNQIYIVVVLGFIGLVLAAREPKQRIREIDNAEATLQKAHDELAK
jgi:hypothetical protein